MEGAERGKDGELGTDGIQKEKDTEGGVQKWIMLNSRMRAQRENEMETQRSGGSRENVRRHKIVKSRLIERERGKKNKCKPLRINSLISLWGRMKKEDFHLLSSQPRSDISLSLCLIF